MRQAADQLGYDRPEDVERWLSPVVGVMPAARRGPLLGDTGFQWHGPAAGVFDVPLSRLARLLRTEQASAECHGMGQPA